MFQLLIILGLISANYGKYFFIYIESLSNFFYYIQTLNMFIIGLLIKLLYINYQLPLFYYKL